MSDEKERAIFARNLNFYMQLNNKQQSDVITDLGINKSTMSTWCTGTKMPRMGTIQTLARYFGIKKSNLVEEQQFDAGSLGIDGPFSLSKIRRLPLYSRLEAQAPYLFENNILDHIYVELTSSVDHFAFVASNDSMNAARIQKGDILIVRLSSVANSGEIVVVSINGEQPLIRKIYKQGQSITLMPQTLGSEEKPIFLDLMSANFVIIGRVMQNIITY